MSYRHGILMAVVFAFFQGGFPFLGAMLGAAFRDMIASVDHWVAFGMLLAVGGKMVYDALCEAGCEEQVYIVGDKQEQIRDVLGEGVAYVFQEKRLGTGHAVMQAEPFLEERGGYVIVLPGDCPMVSATTIAKALTHMEQGDDAAVVITASADVPTGYGRVVRDENGNVLRIVEHRDCNEEELKIKEINSSMYVFKTSLLTSALGRLSAENAQKEYYLTDTIDILIKDGGVVGSVICDFEDTLGVNDR